MSDTEIELLQLRLADAERQILGLNQWHSVLYQSVETLEREVGKLRGAPFPEIATQDPFLDTDTIRDERDSLAQWKREQLTVKAWWGEVDAYVRAHPSTVAGESVAAAALRLLRDRDELVRAKRITS